MSLDQWFATYRIQLHKDFPLSSAADIMPYLRELGISHVYLSPCFQAVPDSMHGYDVIDHGKISDDLGGEEGWALFQQAAKHHGMGVLLDIVPNHMATHASNPWWNDLLTHGPFSSHAGTFDVFPTNANGKWEVALCVLAEPYGSALAEGAFSIYPATSAPRLRYMEESWPLNPTSWQILLEPLAPELEPVFDELKTLQAITDPEPDAITRYEELTGHLTTALAAIQTSDTQRKKLSALCAEISQSQEQLHTLISEQFYRLAWWKLDGELINYRRFFNISTLIGLKMESPEVFDRVHARVAEMLESGEVDGLRIDHPDGLRDPEAYFARLRGHIPNGPVFVEKILDGEETLPANWQVDGTVGYEFLSQVNRLWMDSDNADTLSSLYAEFTGHPIDYQALLRDKKSHVLEVFFRADLERLSTLAVRISREHWMTQDLSPSQIQSAIALLTISLSVYRTYMVPGVEPRAEDRAVITDALALARSRAHDTPRADGGIDPEVFDFFEAILMRKQSGPLEDEFLARWQQLTPAVMAKGAEDTTFYCFDRLVSCNEVGSSPSALGIAPAKFHEFCTRLGNDWPANLLPTSTHDNKRSADARARMSLLSEIPGRWAAALQEWSALNLPAWKGRAPDRHAEYLLYQTLIGAWPIGADRAWAYLLKASREAKLHTSWSEPNEPYESGLKEFCEAILASADFLVRLEAFVEPLIMPGRINSLAQTLIQLTAPGIPDIYQGSELWDLSLVDPDNRRPVNYDARRQLLAGMGDGIPHQWKSGMPKLWMIQRVLQIRRDHAAEFRGAYQPVSAGGTRLGHLFTYQRGGSVLVAVPRFTLTLDGDWGDTVLPLPPGAWENIFDADVYEGEVSPKTLFEHFPVAMLVRK